MEASAISFVHEGSDKKCPLKEVQRYEYVCAELGNVREPKILRQLKDKNSAIACAQVCHATRDCRSFRWTKKSKTCLLYGKYLAQMFTDYDIEGPGMLWDRDCFSTDCNLIDACDASLPCQSLHVGDDYNTYYTQYACNYGHTAKATSANGSPYPMSRRTFSAATMDACDAIRACTGGSGTFDVHLHIASNQWECIRYFDSSVEYGTDDYCYPETYEEDVSKRRYIVRNESVGAGYGFWRNGFNVFVDTYYCPAYLYP